MVAASFVTIIGTIIGLGLVAGITLFVLGHADRFEGRELWFWGSLSVVVWLTSWALIWLGRETDWIKVYEPAAVAGSLGVISIGIFVGIYVSADTERLTTAFAGAFLVFYLALSTDLLVLRSFRESFDVSSTLVDDLLGKLPWVVGVVVSFYFVTDAVKHGQDEKTARAREKSRPEQQLIHDTEEETQGEEMTQQKSLSAEPPRSSGTP